MTYTITLSETQELGALHRASHNGYSTIEEYLQYRVGQDADAGHKEYMQDQIASITAKIVAEPSILSTIETTVNEQVSIIVADREAKAEEARVAMEFAREELPIEEIKAEE